MRSTTRKNQPMTQKNKGGRPETERKKPVTIRLSDEAVALLSNQSNKSAFIDSLIRGNLAQIECPNCHTIITIKAE